MGGVKELWRIRWETRGQRGRRIFPAIGVRFVVGWSEEVMIGVAKDG